MEEKKEPRIKILVACHKADPNIRQDDIYMPIQVGAALHPELDLGFQKDNEGDNISHKNASYCELTALYWAWKNLKDVDYIGLCHYRRYFNYDIDIEKIKKDFDKYDVISLEKRSIYNSNLGDLSSLTCMEDTIISIDTLLKYFPTYKSAAYQYLIKENSVSQCNMFIMQWKDFDEYCTFLFDLLYKIEQRLPNHTYTRLKRNLGYIAENFQGIYFKKNNFKIKYVKKNTIGLETNRLKEHIRRIRNKLVFSLFTKPKNFKTDNSIKTGLINDNSRGEPPGWAACHRALWPRA